MSVQKTEFVNTIVRAGAGAGKTYGLIHKIVDLVREYTQSHQGQLPRFVVTTFTRKATQEVRERLLAKALDLRKEDPEFGNLFLKFLKSSGFLLVSTIHGVLNQFLKQHGGVIGLDPDFQITSDTTLLLNEVLHQFLSSDPTFSPLAEKYGWRRLKDFLLEHHRASLFNPEISPLPEEFIENHWEESLDSAKSSAEALLSFVLGQLTKPKKSEASLRLHQALSEFLTIMGKDLGLWEKLLEVKKSADLFPSHLGSMSNWEESTKDHKKNLYEIIGRIKQDPWTSFDTWQSHKEDQIQLQNLGFRFSQAWYEQKIGRAELELEDLELLSLYILRRFPKETLHFSNSWNYWFIDEYQDTSPIQVEILNYLVGDRPHYVVGDPQQSIYFFRGARSKVFHQKLDNFANSGDRIEFKKVNRRSQSPTLGFINDLMDRVNKHQFSPMDSLPEKNTDHLLVGHFYQTPIEEGPAYEGILKSLERLLHRGENPSSIAILCRENAELQNLYRFLNESGLPCQIASQGNFLGDRVVRDALALWSFLLNPADDKNLLELLRSPWFRVKDEDLLLAAQQKPAFLWQNLAALKQDSLLRLNQALSDLSTDGHIETWQKLLMEVNACGTATALDPSGKMEGNLWKLIETIVSQNRLGTLDFTDPMGLSLDTDMNHLSEARSIRESQQIKIMTIHASKGLEFEHVFLPFINHSRKTESPDFWSSDLDNKFWTLAMMDPQTYRAAPNFWAKKNSEEVQKLLDEESERLFYVAITRAKKSIHFFVPENEEFFSEGGWASYLQEFLNQGHGVFKSDGGHYEFEVLSLTELERSPVETKTAENHEPQFPPLAPLHEAQSQSSSVTDLVQSTEAPSAASIPIHWNTDAIKRGIQIHKELEIFAVLKGVAPLSNQLESFLNGAPFPLRNIITNGFPEWPFCIYQGRQKIEGQIDLWGKDLEGNIWIIDYKTGSKAFVDKALRQLKLYALALHRTKHIDRSMKISLAICYTETRDYFCKEFGMADLLQEFAEITP